VEPALAQALEPCRFRAKNSDASFGGKSELRAQNPHCRQESIGAYKQAWLDQLGLVFISTNQPVEMLVVTKAR